MAEAKCNNCKYLADTHCHILPNVDDGSKSIEMTLNVLKTAKAEGITHIIATPHFKINHRNASLEKREELINEVRKLIEENNLGIKLYLGNEVMFFSDIEESAESKAFSTMNDTDYLLVEFYPDEDFAKIRHGLETVFEMGLTPVLAHTERYMELRNTISGTRQISEMGVILSVNASSIVGAQGFKVKRYVKNLLKERLVSLVSTDSHDDGKRSPKFKECVNRLYATYDKEYVDSILYKNAFEMFNL